VQDERSKSRKPSAQALPPVETPVVPVLGLCAAHCGGLIGLEFQPITVEVSSRRGPAFFQLAGLAETAVREARIRISSALSRMGVTVDEYALTVNLAPANVRKSGSGLDLAIALSVLGAVGHIEEFERPDSLFLGELALDGAVRRACRTLFCIAATCR
jgi:predicted ATPase with chaperone activity